MPSKKRAFDRDEGLDSICHAVKRLHTTSSASMSSEEDFDAFPADEIGSPYVANSTEQIADSEPTLAVQRDAAAGPNQRALLRAVRPPRAPDPFSLRQGAQQHWLRHQQGIQKQHDKDSQCRAESFQRDASRRSVAHQQQQPRIDHDQQNEVYQQSTSQHSSASSAIEAAFEGAEQGIRSSHAEDLAAYEQANHMLKRLHFERLKRRPGTAQDRGS